MAELPPPPAYSEEEFDQKISHVTQLSLDQYQNHAGRDDQWETRDEVVFATDLQRHSIQRLSGAQETLRMSALIDHHSTVRPISETRPTQVHQENLSGSNLSDSFSKQRCTEADLDICGPLAAPPYASVPPPPPTLANPYGSPISLTSDPCPEKEQLGAALDIAVPLTNESPHRQLPYLPSETSAARASFTLTGPSTRGLPQISSLKFPASPNMNFNVELESPITQQRPPQLQSSAILDPKSSLSLHPVPSSRSKLPSNPSHFQDYNSNTTANLTPQTMQAPRINVDLSMVYGRRPAASAFQDSAPPQVFDVSAFYNSSVSAHLGLTQPKATANLLSPGRQSHQLSPSTPIDNPPQATHSTPDRYGPHATPIQGVCNPRPSNFTPQNPFIRSPTPTYPAGHNTNPMPQILAAADEENSNYSPTPPYPAAWTESSNSYR